MFVNRNSASTYHYRNNVLCRPDGTPVPSKRKTTLQSLSSQSKKHKINHIYLYPIGPKLPGNRYGFPLQFAANPRLLSAMLALFEGETYRWGDLRNASRKRELMRFRQVAMGIMRRLTDWSLFVIGKMVMRDHTTVSHAVRQPHVIEYINYYFPQISKDDFDGL